MITIYALSNSNSETDYRYVGMTSKSLEERLNSHISACNIKQDTDSLAWMKSVLDEGNELVITRIAMCDHMDYEWVEQSYITRMNKLGYKLTNIDKGGCGGAVLHGQFQQSIKRSKYFKNLPVIEQMTERAKWAVL